MIRNFIDFCTDKIRPSVFNEYSNSQYQSGDYTGADESTQDFSKLGWMMSVRESMKTKGTWTADVDTLINSIFILTHTNEAGSTDNFKTLSNGHYNVLQQLVYDNRNNEDFTLDFSYINSFEDKTAGMMNEKFEPSQMSANEMIVEFGLHNAASKISSANIGTRSTEQLASPALSLYMAAYKKAAIEHLTDASGEGKAAKTLNVIRAKMTEISPLGYNAFFFQNSKTQSASLFPKNEISRVVSSLSQSLLEVFLPKIMSDISDKEDIDTLATNLKNSVTASGLSSTQVNFDLEGYVSLLGNSYPQNTGYTPLYFYMNKYRSECKLTILNKLSEAFSPVAPNVSDNVTEGFTPLSLLAYYLDIDNNYAWTTPEIVSFIKAKAQDVVIAGNNYATLAALGSVRDFTKGKSNNSFGTINNIMLKINDRHSQWWTTVSAEAGNTLTSDDFEVKYNPLVESILGLSIMPYDTYKIWMFEYGKEV